MYAELQRGPFRFKGIAGQHEESNAEEVARGARLGFDVGGNALVEGARRVTSSSTNGGVFPWPSHGEGQTAGQHFVEDRAEAENVGGDGDVLRIAAGLFRSHVTWRAKNATGLGCALRAAGVWRGRNRRHRSSYRDRGGMLAGLRSRCRIPWRCAWWTARVILASRRAASVGAGEAAARRCSEVAAFGEAHAEVGYAGVAPDVVDGQNVGVLELSRGDRLGEEAFEIHRRGLVAAQNGLDATATLKTGLARAVDDARCRRA